MNMKAPYTAKMYQALINYAFVPEKVYPLMAHALIEDINVKAAECITDRVIRKSLFGFAAQLQETGVRYQIQSAKEYAATLENALADQVNEIMEQDRQARIKDQKWLDRIAMASICPRSAMPTAEDMYYSIDYDNYTEVQLFFEKQHKAGSYR